MTSSDDLVARLRARIEAATGPDRELDAAVFAATLPRDGVGFDGFGLIEGWHFEHTTGDDFGENGRVVQWVVGNGERHRRGSRTSPALTASIDAAIGLVEQRLPGTYWQINAAKPITADEPVGPFTAHLGDVSATAATPPLAILVALLAALTQAPPQ